MYTYSKAVITIMVSLLIPISTAHAEEDTAQRDRQWYGWQIMANDAAGLALAVGALSTIDDSETVSQTLFGGTVATWGFGGPAIHWAHGNKKTAVKSLGLRWGLPLAVGGLLYLVGDNDPDADCQYFCVTQAETNFVFGYLLGGVVAQGVDWFAWSYKERSTRKKANSSLTPSISVTPKGGYVGLGASF